MTGRIFTADHHVYDLPQPLAWTVTHTGSVPCDSYSMTVLYEADMAPVLRLAAALPPLKPGRRYCGGLWMSIPWIWMRMAFGPPSWEEAMPPGCWTTSHGL